MKELSIKDLLKITEEKNGAEKIYDYFLKKAEEFKYLNTTIGNPLPRKGLIPYGLKDIFLVEGTIVTAGSEVLLNYIAPYTATIVKKLEAHGYYPIQKANLDEFACGSTGINGLNGPILSPLKYKEKHLVAGGSSAGSASGVLAGLFPFAIGTDTAGSVLVPAAMCGLYGLAPTYGAISRYGMIPLNNQLDKVGLITKSIDDMGLIFDILKGKDFNDPTSCDYIAWNKPNKSFAIFDELDYPKKVYDHLVKLGYKPQKYSLPCLLDGLNAYCILTSAELASNLSRFIGSMMDGKFYENLNDLYFGFRDKIKEEVKRRIVVGNYVLLEANRSNLLDKAQSIQRDISFSLYEILKNNDFILSYTGPAAMTVEEALNNVDPVNIYKCDLYTVFGNLSGLPGITIPGLNDDGRPIGVKIVGNPFSEEYLMKVATEIKGGLNE